MKLIWAAIRHLVRAVIAIVAAGNLLAVIFFQYRLPEPVLRFFPFVRMLGLTAEEQQEEDRQEELADARLVIPSQSLNYAGNGELDLYSGVYVQEADGSRAEDVTIRAEVTEGTTRLDKVVLYTAELGEDHVLTGSRRLSISSRYVGPTLTVSQKLPEMDTEEGAAALLRLLKREGAVYADDGFGNDITEKITAEMPEPGEDDETVPMTLQVTNVIGDSFETQIMLEASATGVVMKLTAKETTIHVGDTFSFYPFIKECHDAEGNDLHHNIMVRGYVDNYTAGDYELEIYCMDANQVSSPVRKLMVHVVN